MRSISHSFFYELVQYAQHRNLLKGKLLHAHVIKTGLYSCIYISNSLINLYAKCQLLTEARLTFDSIQNKDIVSWNCLINGYSQLGGRKSFVAIMQLFRCMRAENVVPNAHTFAGIFTAASNLEDCLSGEQAHVLAIKTASFSDVFVGSSLLNMYCKTGHVLDARKLFDRMPERNSVSWATMISGYAILRLTADALEILRLMMWEAEGVLDEFVLTSVLSAFTLPKFIGIGQQIHCYSIKNGLISVASVGNAVVTMYMKCGDLEDARQTFELSTDKNSITWSAMITGFAQSGEGANALKLFSNMHFSGMKPSEFTIVGVLNASSDICSIEEGKQVHAYLLRLGYGLHTYVVTALVDMYAKCGFIGDARKGFDCVIEVDKVLWTSMIGGYVQNGENESAINLYCRILSENIVPNDLTMVSVLKACSNLAVLEQGKQIHAQTIKFGFSLEVPIGSALSTMYAKCGSLDDGNIIFTRIPMRDVVSWNSMLSGLSQNGQGIEALELFQEMQREGSKPDAVTFLSLLTACSHMGFVEKGWFYFRMMSDEFGIAPRVEHYACMVDILGRAGKLYEAKEFIESATIEHGLSLWRILLSAARNCRNYDLGAYAGEKLMELGSQESSAYVLLSSIYSAVGRWVDVERVRRLMSIRGVNKEPGCSWVELKNLVHVFVVGDQMHPQIKSVRAELRRLSKLMMDEGYQPASDLIIGDFLD